MRFFCQKNQKILNVGKVKEYDEERVFFEEKTFPSFKITSLSILEGARYAGGSRPSCFFWSQRKNYEWIVLYRISYRTLKNNLYQKSVKKKQAKHLKTWIPPNFNLKHRKQNFRYSGKL